MLSAQELRSLTKEMSPSSSIIASTISRLYLASPNPSINIRQSPNSILASFPRLNEKKWTFSGVQGALLLVVDRSKNAVVFQLFDLESLEAKPIKRFEAEIYYNMEYKSLSPNFHAFEIPDCVCGLHFKEPATAFFKKVKSFVPSPPAPVPSSQHAHQGMQISSVLNVAHTGHVSESTDGFNLDTLSPEWKAVFKQAGVKKKDLKDPQTRRQLVKSIAQGGYSLDANPLTYHTTPTPTMSSSNQLDPKVKIKEIDVPSRLVSAATPTKLLPSTLVSSSKTPSNLLSTEAAYTKTSLVIAAAPTSRIYTKQELNKHYTHVQVDMYESYQKELMEYEKKMKTYELSMLEWEQQQRTQKAESWEADNSVFLREEEQKKRESRDTKYTRKPPPLPARKTGSTLLPPALPPRKTTPSPTTTTTSPSRRQNEEPPHEPDVPIAPDLPPLKNGDNPVQSLQDQILGVKLKKQRPISQVLLVVDKNQSSFITGGAQDNAALFACAPSSDLLGLMKLALQERRVQLMENQDNEDSDEGWSSDD